MKCPSFDIKSKRSFHLHNDKYTLISLVWTTFIENNKLCYKQNDNITINEQLFPTKTRVTFGSICQTSPINLE